jgi:ankyrin repeat protein
MAKRKGANENKVPLISAVRDGDVERICALLEAGADVDATDAQSSEISPGLTRAYREGDLERLETTDSNVGRTALMWAARLGRADVVRLLLASRSNVNVNDKVGLTPLMLAARYGHAEVVRVLIGAGANVSAAECDGSDSLLFAVENQHTQVVRELLAAGADPNCQSKDGATPLLEASQCACAECVRQLLDAGADVDTSDKNGTTALMKAARAGSLESLQMLLEAGADASHRNLDSWSALSEAAIRGNPEVIGALLRAGADVRDMGGQVALRIAAERGHGQIVQELLAAGADVDARDADGKTVLDAVKSKLEMAEVRKDLDKPGLQNVLGILKKAGTKWRTDKGPRSRHLSIEPESQDSPDFASQAAAVGFRKAVEELGRLCGVKAQRWRKINGGFSFAVPEEKVEAILSTYHRDFLRRGCYLFRSIYGIGAQPDRLFLLPTADKFRVVEAMHTNGADSNLATADVIRWLRDLEQDQPFELIGIGPNYLEGRFTSTIKNPRDLAKRIFEFCPDIVDQGTGSMGELARELRRSHRLFFWWD